MQLANLLVICALAVTAVSAQQMPPPRPKSAPKPPTTAPPRPAVPGAILLVTADDACDIFVDGERLGTLKRDEVRKFPVTPGQHLVHAVAGTLKWEQVVSVDKPVQVIVRTGLVAMKTERDRADAEAATKLTEELSAVAGIVAKGRTSEAIAQYQQVGTKYSTCELCYARAGFLQLMSGDFAAAEESYRRAIAIKESPSLHEGLALVYTRARKHDLALQTTQKALDLYAASGTAPSAYALYVHGISLWNVTRPEQAREFLNRAATSNPREALTQLHLARVNLNLGKIDEARTAYTRYAELAPNDPLAAEVRKVAAQLAAYKTSPGPSTAPQTADSSPPTASPADSAPAQPVRVGANIKPPTKVKHVPPVYPREAQAARLEGVIILEATIDATGKVTAARVLRPIPLLDQAALEAVPQWEFTPTTLNDAPVPVIMTVTVNFTLQ